MKAFLAVSALVLLAGCGGSGGSTGTNVVRMTSTDTFSPQSLTVAAGETVQWRNQDLDNHSVKPDVATPNMDSDTTFPNGLASGDTFSWTVPGGTASGTKFYYHCRFHGTAGDGTQLGGGMAGVITVQ